MSAEKLARAIIPDAPLGSKSRRTLADAQHITALMKVADLVIDASNLSLEQVRSVLRNATLEGHTFANRSDIPVKD